VKTLGITGLSKSQVSERARDLDEQVTAFRTRPLDQGPYSFVAADALTMKVREGGRVVKVAVLVATGVNADGYREILGLQVSSVEDGAGWLTFWLVLGANTFRLFSGVFAAIGDHPELLDVWDIRLHEMPTTVVSTILTEPLDWPDETPVPEDAVDVVAQLKETSPVPLRSHGTWSCWRPGPWTGASRSSSTGRPGTTEHAVRQEPEKTRGGEVG